MKTRGRRKYLGAGALAGAIFLAGILGTAGFAGMGAVRYDANASLLAAHQNETLHETPLPMRELSASASSTPADPALHISTPEIVRAVYMTSWVAATPSIRDRLVKLVDETELNAMVIDIKDYTGKIAFKISDPAAAFPTELANLNADENRIRDIREFLEMLHQKKIYAIARIAVFQDPYLVKIHPELAVKRGDGKIWADRKGMTWIDPGAKVMWDYTAAIAREAHRIGFDEVNFDYVRFPSDGNISDMVFPISAVNFTGKTKREIIQKFWEHLGSEMKKSSIPSSVDVFGMTTTAQDDMGIGQILEDALANFDFVAPMVYPSHYPNGFNGMKNPAALPYETVQYAIASGIDRAKAASSSPQKIRPWIQDFDLGGEYGIAEVRAQIRALNELGLSSWMVWDPSNHYTAGAYKGT